MSWRINKNASEVDRISRQAVIDSLYDWSNHSMTDAETWHLRQVIGDIKSMPSVTLQEPRWIPVTEQLPEKDGMYLVSISQSSRMEKRVDTDFYSHFEIWQIFGKFVTAWMPLPEPYKAESAKTE